MNPASLRVVLVRPRDPNNIGAAARALANFGLGDLRVVAPHPPVWREAKSAVGAEGLLREATECATIEESVAGCALVWATSSVKRRSAETPVLDLPSVRWPAGPLAILFGPEKTGLTAEDLAYASAVLRIPTGSRQPSMNLAASVAVICYQYSLIALTPTLDAESRERKSRSVRDARMRERGKEKTGIEMKSRVWESVRALAAGVGWPAGERTRRLKAAVYRAGLSDADAGMALELLRRLSARRG